VGPQISFYKNKGPGMDTRPLLDARESTNLSSIRKEEMPPA